jgi:hypothetical protein
MSPGALAIARTMSELATISFAGAGSFGGSQASPRRRGRPLAPWASSLAVLADGTTLRLHLSTREDKFDGAGAGWAIEFNDRHLGNLVNVKPIVFFNNRGGRACSPTCP